jgi:Fur family transcriptional regulator, peroxide stress response regulator
MEKNQLVKTLEEAGIRASYQRLCIYRLLVQSREHPSAERVYQDLLLEIPSLSRTTVYNTLNLLIDKNLIKAITIENNELHYDALLSEHGHFCCEQCGKIANFSIQIDLSTSLELQECLVSEKDVYVKGLCRECRSR